MSDPFNNNWRLISETPDENFRQVQFHEMISRSTAWHLPNTWSIVVRVENDSGQIVEKAFKTEAAARRFIEKADENGWEHTYYNEEVMGSTYALEEA